MAFLGFESTFVVAVPSVVVAGSWPLAQLLSVQEWQQEFVEEQVEGYRSPFGPTHPPSVVPRLAFLGACYLEILARFYFDLVPWFGLEVVGEAFGFGLVDFDFVLIGILVLVGVGHLVERYGRVCFAPVSSRFDQVFDLVSTGFVWVDLVRHRFQTGWAEVSETDVRSM